LENNQNECTEMRRDNYLVSHKLASENNICYKMYSVQNYDDYMSNSIVAIVVEYVVNYIFFGLSVFIKLHEYM